MYSSLAVLLLLLLLRVLIILPSKVKRIKNNIDVGKKKGYKKFPVLP
jgi:hypothetical protein